MTATAERKEYGVGRLLSHARRAPNLEPRVALVDGVPRLSLHARSDIAFGTELSFDYGDRRESSIASFAWLAE